MATSPEPQNTHPANVEFTQIPGSTAGDTIMDAFFLISVRNNRNNLIKELEQLNSAPPLIDNPDPSLDPPPTP